MLDHSYVTKLECAEIGPFRGPNLKVYSSHNITVFAISTINDSPNVTHVRGHGLKDMLLITGTPGVSEFYLLAAKARTRINIRWDWVQFTGIFR